MNGPYTCEMLRTFDMDAYEKQEYVSTATEWFTKELLREVMRIRRHNLITGQGSRHTPREYNVTLSFNVMHNQLHMFTYTNIHRVMDYTEDVVQKLRERFPDIKMKIKSYPGFNAIEFDWSKN